MPGYNRQSSPVSNNHPKRAYNLWISLASNN